MNIAKNNYFQNRRRRKIDETILFPLYRNKQLYSTPTLHNIVSLSEVDHKKEGKKLTLKKQTKLRFK